MSSCGQSRDKTLKSRPTWTYDVVIMNKANASTKSPEFTRFEHTLRKLIAVPKSEIDKEKAKYERQREKEGKRKKLAK